MLNTVNVQQEHKSDQIALINIYIYISAMYSLLQNVSHIHLLINKKTIKMKSWISK